MRLDRLGQLIFPQSNSFIHTEGRFASELPCRLLESAPPAHSWSRQIREVQGIRRAQSRSACHSLWHQSGSSRWTLFEFFMQFE